MFSGLKIWAILTLLAFLCFATLVGFQVWEYVYYGSDPSVWPAVAL